MEGMWIGLLYKGFCQSRKQTEDKFVDRQTAHSLQISLHCNRQIYFFTMGKIGADRDYQECFDREAELTRDQAQNKCADQRQFYSCVPAPCSLKKDRKHGYRRNKDLASYHADQTYQVSAG